MYTFIRIVYLKAIEIMQGHSFLERRNTLSLILESYYTFLSTNMSFIHTE